jgi:hypothetical protein
MVGDAQMMVFWTLMPCGILNLCTCPAGNCCLWHVVYWIGAHVQQEIAVYGMWCTEFVHMFSRKLLFMACGVLNLCTCPGRTCFSINGTHLNQVKLLCRLKWPVPPKHLNKHIVLLGVKIRNIIPWEWQHQRVTTLQVQYCVQYMIDYLAPLGPKHCWISQFSGYYNITLDVYVSISSNCMDRPNHLICHLISRCFPHLTFYSLLITTFVNTYTKFKNTWQQQFMS